MYIIEIFLPLGDNAGHPYPAKQFSEEKEMLADRFGGLTAYNRAPAEGIWGERASHDDIIIFEVMTSSLDHEWWKTYRRLLEKKFRQDQILIRATLSETL